MYNTNAIGRQTRLNRECLFELTERNEANWKSERCGAADGGNTISGGSHVVIILS